MAYLDTSSVFSPAFALPVPAPEDFAPGPVEVAGFAPTEWAVIALARRDGLATLNQPRRSKLGRWLFGQPRTYSLAAERLESLRRLAVEAWHRPLAISPAGLGGFIAAGFGSAQLAALLAATGAARAMAGQNPGWRAAPGMPA